MRGDGSVADTDPFRRRPVVGFSGMLPIPPLLTAAATFREPTEPVVGHSWVLPDSGDA